MEVADEQRTQFYAAMAKPPVHLPAFSWYFELMSLLFSYLAADLKGCAALTLKKAKQNKTWDHPEQREVRTWMGRKVHLTSTTQEASPAFGRKVPLLLDLCEHRRALGEASIS